MNARTSITLDELVRLKGEAHGFGFLPRQPVHSLLSGRHASRLRGRGLAFEELRRYQPGDDVRTIDWRATARRRAAHVRIYNEERERPVLLLVDQRAPMFFGSRRTMKSVVAAELAALAAWRTLKAGDRVGGVVFNDREQVEIRPQRSQTAVLRLLHELARMNEELVNAPQAEMPVVTLNKVLETAMRQAKQDHLIVLISDFDGADEETRRLTTLLAAHNDVLAVLTYDPLGASLTGAPGMLAMRRGERMAVPGGAAFAEAFREQFRQRLDEWREVFRALRVPVIPVSTAEPVADQLRELFGRRMRP